MFQDLIFAVGYWQTQVLKECASDFGVSVNFHHSDGKKDYYLLQSFSNINLNNAKSLYFSNLKKGVPAWYKGKI